MFSLGNNSKLGNQIYFKIAGHVDLDMQIEHRVKLHVFGNNSKTVNNIRNLTWVKIISTGRSYVDLNMLHMFAI
jgi:hypothetical protein